MTTITQLHKYHNHLFFQRLRIFKDLQRKRQILFKMPTIQTQPKVPFTQQIPIQQKNFSIPQRSTRFNPERQLIIN
jgi:hypothetical protein